MSAQPIHGAHHAPIARTQNAVAAALPAGPWMDFYREMGEATPEVSAHAGFRLRCLVAGGDLKVPQPVGLRRQHLLHLLRHGAHRLQSPALVGGQPVDHHRHQARGAYVQGSALPTGCPSRPRTAARQTVADTAPNTSRALPNGSNAPAATQPAARSGPPAYSGGATTPMTIAVATTIAGAQRTRSGQVDCRGVISVDY
ncbi:hypothetical protein [Streptacidiphilus melanogenes]|uniref:hypothetical protein n=1 Tax=Streptacidiphilus melanogenes TaxID=411235 RepID=UPI0005A83472|nr:hypothetical protein [Streptacidiphilus melanogenes]